MIAAVLASGAAAEYAGAREVPFAEPPAITTGAEDARSVITADVDGDGDPDVVAASSADNTIAWHENTAGDGTSWTSHTISTGVDGAFSVFAADVDGDGDFDVLSASSTDARIAWYENDGSATSWALHTIAISASAARSVFATDVDGDGDQDALSASKDDDKIAWYENTAGDGSGWTTHTITTTANGAWSVFAADVDGDGDQDALSASFYDETFTLDHAIAWYENTNGNGSVWSLHTVITNLDGAHSVFATDLDGDGDTDVLSASLNDDKIAWYDNTNGDGSAWSLHTITTNAFGATSVFAGDVDDDGDVDALSASLKDDKIAWYENTVGDGSAWTIHTIATNADGAFSVFATDLDGDGDVDALSASQYDNTIAWYRNDTIHRSAAFPAGLSIATLDDARDIAAGDITGNGLTDTAAVSFNGNAVVWYPNASASWTPFTVTTTAGGASSVELADLDADGDLDIVYTAALDNAVAWQENDGTPFDGGWTAHTITANAESARDVVAVDLDGDGDLDLASASLVDNKITWYENDGSPGDGGWTTHTITELATTAKRVIAFDPDGDGDPDLASVNFFDNEVAWYENDGTPTDGGWATHTLAVGVQEPESAFAADLDGDGDPDLLAASQYSDAVTWHENDGTPADAAWIGRTITTSASVAQAVHAADMDSDGDLDALSASSGDGKVAWYENDGAASSWTLHTVTLSAGTVVSVTAADVDGDGDPDPLSAPLGSADLLWYPNEGGQFALPTLDVAQKVVGDGQQHDLLDVVMFHRGRSGDSDTEWASIQLEFTDGAGTPLGLSDQTDLFQSVSVYLDDGSGAFEPEADTQLATGSSLCCSGGVRTINFLDGDPDVTVLFGVPRTYFVVVEMAADASSQTPSTFKATHLTESTSTGEDAAHDIPLKLEFSSNTDTDVVDTQLDNATCEAPFDLQLVDWTVDFGMQCNAGTLIRAENFTLTGSAVVTFRAGESVRLDPGFAIQSGEFTVEIDPALKP